MNEYLSAIFGPSGALAAKFPGYQPRAGQVELAQAVDRAIREHGHLLAEAPTGTGKSLAYAVPAIYHVKHSKPRCASPREPEDGLLGEQREEASAEPVERADIPPRAVIVTANIALQEQLVKKDLPLLREILPWPFSYALLKGIGNYLCQERLAINERQQCEPDLAAMNEQIRQWAAETETGDKSELPFEPPARLWSRFSTSSDDCSGRECAFYKSCSAKRARKAAAGADVIVTNYALLFIDLIVRERTNGEFAIIPPYTIAVLDEGHKAAEIARDFFGFRVSPRALDAAADLLPAEQKIQMHDAQQKFFLALGEHRRSPFYKARIRTPNVVDSSHVEAQLAAAASWYETELRELEDEGSDSEPTADEIKHYKRVARKRTRALELREQIRAAMRLYAPSGAPTIEDVYYIDEEDGGRTVLRSIPISVAERLRDYLFKATGSVSVTSATLAARSSFEYVAADLGVEKPSTLIAASPFSWSDQVLLVLPIDVPLPNDPKFTSVVVDRCAQTIELARGRMLGLFTSYKHLNAAYDHVRRQSNYRILRQGEMPRTRLIEEFKRDVNSVLLGTESFWAGVDVPGESLSCVFIDKLPFTPPDDPLLDALSEREPKRSFMKYSVPQAIIAFKQGFGRLIRTTTDRGVVVLLDRRVSTMFYGRHFIESLPPVPQSTNLSDVRNFLDCAPLIGVPGARRSLLEV